MVEGKTKITQHLPSPVCPRPDLTANLSGPPDLGGGTGSRGNRRLLCCRAGSAGAWYNSILLGAAGFFSDFLPHWPVAFCPLLNTLCLRHSQLPHTWNPERATPALLRVTPVATDPALRHGQPRAVADSTL